MRRAERLFRLVNEMRSRGLCRAADLAAHFEVGIATIYRDIAHLQASGLPIDGEAGVGYMLRTGFDLPNVTFTHDQIDALAMGLAHVETTADPALAAAAREVRAKLQAGLPDPQDRALLDAPHYSSAAPRGGADWAPIVRDAIRNKRVLRLTYTNGQGLGSERTIRPLLIWDMPSGWMVSGWCELRGDFRTFRWDRMSKLEMTEHRFEDEDGTNLRAFMAAEP